MRQVHPELDPNMFAAALMDPQPLLRLGLARILAGISSIGEIHTYDPDALEPPEGSPLPVDILLIGMNDGAPAEQALFEHMVSLTAPRHILLLTDAVRMPPVWHPAVAGRIRRSAPSDLVEAAVKLILAGGRCFPGVAGILDDDVGEVAAAPVVNLGRGLLPSEDVVTQGARDLRITPRQFEILVLRAHGMSLKAVGRALGISEATVKAHASGMYRRLDVANCQQAIRLAARRGVALLPSAEAGALSRD